MTSGRGRGHAGRAAALIALCALGLLAGCSRAAPPSERIVPLPPDAIDVSALDADRLVVLMGSQSKAIEIFSRKSGAAEANFAAPGGAVALGYAGPSEFLDVIRAAHGDGVEVRSTGGALLGTVPVPRRVLAIVGHDTTVAYVLVGGPPQILEVDLLNRRVSRAFAAPQRAASMSASATEGEPSFLAADAGGAVFERIPGATSWQRLSIVGEDPLYSSSGGAIYTFQRFGDSRLVAVTDRQSQLQIRLIPVALDARRMLTVDDGSLLIFERTPKAANVRSLPCSSPLLAIEPRIKHSKFFGGGAPWQLLGLATPDPDAADTPQPDSTGSKAAGC